MRPLTKPQLVWMAVAFGLFMADCMVAVARFTPAEQLATLNSLP